MKSSDQRLLKAMSKSTKNIYNSSLYCCKHWFNLQQLQTKFIADNLNDFLDILSPKDRLTIGKYLKFKKEKTKLLSLIKYSHKSEVELRTLSIHNGEQLLPMKQKAVLTRLTFKMSGFFREFS